MKINVYMINAKKGLQKNNPPQGWVTKAQTIPVFWDFTHCITKKNAVLSRLVYLISTIPTENIPA
jgi:hypothetical protein